MSSRHIRCLELHSINSAEAEAWICAALRSHVSSLSLKVPNGATAKLSARCRSPARAPACLLEGPASIALLLSEPSDTVQIVHMSCSTCMPRTCFIFAKFLRSRDNFKCKDDMSVSSFTRGCNGGVVKAGVVGRAAFLVPGPQLVLAQI